MAQNDNVVFKTSTTATIDDLFSWNKSTGQIAAKTDNIPIVPGTVYFTADGHIVHDLAQNNRLWMSKNAYSAIYAEDVAETNTDIANAIKYSIHYVEGPTTDTTPGTWTGTINGITELYDGLTIIYVPAVAGGSSTTTLNINGLGAKTCYYSNTNAMTTHYSVGTPILLTYRNNCWRRADYNSNTTYSAMSVAEMRTGTATSERSIRADYLKTFLSTLGGTNLTLTHSNSAPYLQLNHDPSGITAGTYGNNSQQTPSYGGTFNIPYFTVDAQGHITNASTTTVKIPASDNTDYKVRQTPINSNDNNNYRILLSNSANDTSEDSISKKNANLIYNPTENKLSTGNIKLTGELDVTGNVYLRNQTTVDNLTAGSLIVNGNSTFNNDINLAQGAVKWTSNSLPSVTSADYFLVIDAFTNGGATKHITKANAIKSLISSSAIGSSTKPVYWTGNAFSAITSYSGAAALTGTPTAPTAAAGTSTTQIATTEFVTNAVAQGFVANDAMVFKGLIGSNQPITQLPTSGYNAGWTYRVANAGIFAGEYCEVGDLLIAINDGPASGSSVINTDWGKVEHNIDGAVFRGSGASNSSVGSSTQPVYVNGSGIITAITGAIANDTTGNAATATQTKFLMNRGGSTVTIQDNIWNHNQTPFNHTNAATVWHQRWKQSGLTYTPLGGDATAITDSGDLVYWLSAGNTSNVLFLNMAIDGIIYAGGGFKGDLNGTATNATQLISNDRMDYGWNGINYFNISTSNQSAAKVNDTPFSSNVWTHILRFNNNNASGYYTDLAIPFNQNSIYYKRIAAGSLQNSTTNGGWIKVLDQLNYTSYTVTKTGSGASGTWNINISGNAATASKLSNTSKIGDTNKPVYFKADGTPAAINYTIDKAVPSNAVFTDRYVNSATFADDSTNTAASPVKMTLTRAGSDTATVTASIPKVSSSSAGVVPKGTAVSSQSQSTKFLREDGTWAAPSYTVNTNTDTLVKQTAKTDNVEYKILTTTSESPTSGNAAEAAYDTGITINPCIHRLSAAQMQASAGLYSYVTSIVNLSGYIKFATLTVTNIYFNRGIQISYASRSNTGGIIYCIFSNANNTDPNLTITKTGPAEIYYKKSDTSTWDLYISKTENYDQEIFSIINPGQLGVISNPSDAITWKSEHVAELPEGYLTAAVHTIKLNIIGNAATATTLATGSILPIAQGGTGQNNTDNFVKVYTRSQMGNSINYDNPGVQGLFEARPTSEITVTGKLPGGKQGYYPMLSLKTENVMMQIAGSSQYNLGWWIRGRQKANVTLENIDWEQLVTNSGTWDINITGNATTATKATQDGNGNNIINTYLTKTAGVTNITWDNTNKKLIKTINNSNSDIVTLYAANLKLNNTAVYNTELEIKNIKIGNGSTSTSTKNVKLEYNETLETLNFVFS